MPLLEFKFCKSHCCVNCMPKYHHTFFIVTFSYIFKYLLNNLFRAWIRFLSHLNYAFIHKKRNGFLFLVSLKYFFLEEIKVNVFFYYSNCQEYYSIHRSFVCLSNFLFDPMLLLWLSFFINFTMPTFGITKVKRFEFLENQIVKQVFFIRII